MEVTVYGRLRAATGGKTVEVDVPDGATVRDALETFVAAYPRAERHLLDDGDVRPSVRVLVDGERADLDAGCRPGASLQLFPAMAGG
jgi:molybdopterin converting factor small subunit